MDWLNPVLSDQLDAPLVKPSEPATQKQQSSSGSSGGSTDMSNEADSVMREDWLMPVPSDQLEAPISSSSEPAAHKQQQQQQLPAAPPVGVNSARGQAASPSDPDTLSADDWLRLVTKGTY
jgi:hypothetical protein